MIPIYNIRDSYTWYRKEALRNRIKGIIDKIRSVRIQSLSEKKRIEAAILVSRAKDLKKELKDFNTKDEELVDIINSLENTNYERLPIKRIERYEELYNIKLEQKPITHTVYKNIVQGYFKFLVKKLFEGHEVKLGAKLGVIAIRGKKVKPIIDWKGDVKGIAPSWSKTKVSWNEKAEKLGLSLSDYIEQIPKSERKLVFCFNEHSDFVKYRIVWFKRNVIVKNKIYYGLTFNRANRRELWKLINEGKEYLVSERQ